MQPLTFKLNYVENKSILYTNDHGRFVKKVCGKNGKQKMKSNRYLQWTKIGSILSELYIFTFLLKMSNVVGYVGAPWSDQVVKWKCFTILELSFYKKPKCHMNITIIHIKKNVEITKSSNPGI